MTRKRANVAVFVPHIGCPHACAFCDQRQISGKTVPVSPDEVRKTAADGIKNLGEAAADSEFAFFGGSFTAVKKSYMVSLLEAATGFVGPGGYRGIRISTRPDAIDGEILAILKQYGVTAIELGAQSMDDEVLRKNRRGHTAADVENASGLIRRAGFELGLQMMTGLYFDTDAGAEETARRLAALGPATVRIYPTIVLRGTLLERLYRQGLYLPQTLDGAVSLCSRLLGFFEERGIKVIRLGLHQTQSLAEGYAAGPMHPAFGELCENARYLEKARKCLRSVEKRRETVLFVHPAAVSKLIGQHRRNIETLEKEFNIKIKVVQDPALPEQEIKAGTDA